MKTRGTPTFFEVKCIVVASMSFFERLWSFSEKDESMDSFAKRINKSRRALNYWKSGKTSPTLKEVERLSKIFNVNPAWLAWGEGEKHGKNKQG